MDYHIKPVFRYLLLPKEAYPVPQASSGLYGLLHTFRFLRYWRERTRKGENKDS